MLAGIIQALNTFPKGLGVRVRKFQLPSSTWELDLTHAPLPRSPPRLLHDQAPAQGVDFWRKHRKADVQHAREPTCSRAKAEPGSPRLGSQEQRSHEDAESIKASPEKVSRFSCRKTHTPVRDNPRASLYWSDASLLWTFTPCSTRHRYCTTNPII